MKNSCNGKVGQAMLQVQKQCEDDCQYQQYQMKIQNATLLEEIVQILVPLFAKKAKALGKRIFDELGKNKIITTRVDYFIKKLRSSKLDPETICKIQRLVADGKKKTILRVLIQKLGSAGGPQLFQEFENDLPQRKTTPVEGSVFLRKEKGLDIYEYRQQISQFEKLNVKTMMVFGQTGCGKSTFLNSIANYITGVELQDQFRYNIIVEDVKNKTGSLTSKITDYYIKDKRTNTVYRLIDTPGFGDTRGISMDQQIVDMVRKKFKTDLDTIHSILFVIKSSSTRVTQYQKYIFQSIMDLFNKDIAPNFTFIFTFSDSGQPQVLQSVKCPQYGFGKYWNQISDPKCLPVNNCGIFDKYTTQNKMIEEYWKIGMNCMAELFKKINSIQPKSLKLSKELIHKKETLANKIRHTHETIQRASLQRQNIKAEIQKIVEYSSAIDSNKDYQYLVPVQIWKSERVGYNVTRCVNCANSNCHVDCRYGDGVDKRNCCAFSGLYCTICPRKCEWKVHRNEKYIMKASVVMEKRTNQDNKLKFQTNNKNKNNSEEILQMLITELQNQMDVILDYSRQMTKLQEELAKTQMSTCKPESTISYLKYLIINQQRNKSSGYLQRIQSYSDAINQIQTMEELSKGKFNPKQIIKKLNSEQFQKIIKKMKNPNILERFKKFILDLLK